MTWAPLAIRIGRSPGSSVRSDARLFFVVPRNLRFFAERSAVAACTSWEAAQAARRLLEDEPGAKR